MQIVHISGRGAFPAEIDNTLKALQTAVGGYIEVVTPTRKLAIICNEEGKIIGLPVTAALSDGNGRLVDMLHGDLVICRTTEDGEFTDIQPEDYPMLKQYLTVVPWVDDSTKTTSNKAGIKI